MDRVAAIAVSFFCLLGAAVASGGATKPFVIPKDPQAITIAQTAIAAMGGASALASYQDSEASGTLTVYGGGSSKNVPITLKCKGTQETRVELLKASGTDIRIVNQGQGAIQRSNGTVIHLLMNNTIAERVGHIPLLSILGEYLNSNVSVKYQGTAKVNGQGASVIAVSYVPSTDAVQGPIFASQTQTLFYVDQATSLIDKIQYQNYDEGTSTGSQSVELYLSKYQTVSGITLPFQQTTYTDGTLYSDLVLDSVSFNVGLPDSQFTLPQ